MTRNLRTSGYLAATVVMLCVAGMSWAGLYGWARNVLHWAPFAAGAVPVSLDIAALTCALLALDTVSQNDPATAYRFLTAVFVSLSAFVNFRYRLTTHNVTEEVFFPVMSVLAYALIDTTIRKYRRDSRRTALGQSARPAPEPLTRYGLLVWLPGIGHPVSAWRARSAELAARVAAPSRTVAPPRPSHDAPRLTGPSRPSRAIAPSQSVAPSRLTGPPHSSQQTGAGPSQLAELSQADAIRLAIETTGSHDPGEVSGWLAEQGRPVARQRVSDVLRRDGATGRRLTAITGAGEAESA
jgi:hypothetical protein